MIMYAQHNDGEPIPAAGFQRLTRADLDSLPRAELRRRVAAESAYWTAMLDQGLSPEDHAALGEFAQLLPAAVDPAAALDEARGLIWGPDGGHGDHTPGDGGTGETDR